MIGGIAGSGKSCSAFALLTAYITALQQNKQDDGEQEKLDENDKKDKKTRKLLYVTQSEYLVKEMEEAWEKLPIAGEKEEFEVEFKTYRQLLEPLEQAGYQPVGIETFADWYEKVWIKNAKKAARTKGEAPPPELDSQTLYQECRIRSGYSPEDYLGLGKKQSQLTRQERAWVNTVYDAYLDHLTDKKLFAPEFSPLALKDYYDLIVVDESQDFSPGQLVSLSLAAKKRAIIYYLDSHQQLFDDRSIRAFLLHRLKISEENHLELDVMHRCPPKIQAAVNEVIALKHRLVGGTGDSYEPTKIEKTLYAEETQGHVHLLDMEMLAKCTWMRELPLGTNFAVVTLESQKEEAKKYFNTQLILTPEEIKGRGYDFIVTFRLFPALFKEAQQRLDEVGEEKQFIHQPKSGQRDDRYTNPLNNIYIGFSRCMKALICCEEPTEENEILLKKLRPIADEGLPSMEGLQQANLKDWQKEAAKQKAAGNLNVAAAIEQAILPQPQPDSKTNKPAGPAKPKRRAGKGNMNLAATREGNTGKTSISSRRKKGKANRNSTATRKEEPPRQVQTITAQPSAKSLEEAYAIKLHTKFNEKLFALTLRKANVADLLLKKYQTETDSFVLLEQLIKEDKIKTLLSLAANNFHTLLNIPFSELLKCIDQKKSDAHKNAYKSFLKMAVIKKDMEKIKKETSMVKEFFNGRDMEDYTIVNAFEGFEDVKNEQINAAGLYRYMQEESCSPVQIDILGGYCNHLRELHAMGADLNKADAHNRTPAYWLAKYGKIKQIELIKSLGVDFEAGILGQTPANIAAEIGRVEILTLFRKWKLQLDKPGQSVASPIHVAAFHGNLSLLKLFHKWGLNMYVPNNDGDPPIYAAATKKQHEVLELFHSLGLKLDTPFQDGSTIVHIAADNCDLKALELYHQWKIPLDTPNAAGNAPIHFAVAKSNLKVLEAYQRWGENLDLRMENGATLMYVAANKGFLDIVKFLIQHNPQQAMIPARFSAELFFSNITSHYKDNKEIELRAFNKLNERSLAGDPDSEIRLLPIDIAEILGHSAIVAELKKLTPKESLAPIVNFSLGLLQSEKKPADEAVDSIEKEKAQPTDSSSIGIQGYPSTFFNSATELKESGSPNPSPIPTSTTRSI
ncbi:Ankyrin repeats (3 copies) [Legionella nautarum]|uniref:Ankyrin repeats (3 copies) n=1 Tax=Legionella nautarum TaxID=45070 RepID=A0A0W0WWD3_9GAMM|nr:Ankyrin repeats (3 copies) [Legionella nautarum]